MYLNFNSAINDWAYFKRLLAARLPEYSQIVRKDTFKRFLFVTIKMPWGDSNFSNFRFDRKKYKMQEEVASTTWQ